VYLLVESIIPHCQGVMRSAPMEARLKRLIKLKIEIGIQGSLMPHLLNSASPQLSDMLGVYHISLKLQESSAETSDLFAQLAGRRHSLVPLLKKVKCHVPFPRNRFRSALE